MAPEPSFSIKSRWISDPPRVTEEQQIIWGLLNACTNSCACEKEKLKVWPRPRTMSARILWVSQSNTKQIVLFFSTEGRSSPWAEWAKAKVLWLFCSVQGLVLSLRPWIVPAETQSSACYVRDHSAQWMMSLTNAKPWIIGLWYCKINMRRYK